MSRQDISILFEQRLALQRQHGRVFVIVDAREIGSVSADSRRYAAQSKADLSIHGCVVVFGADLLTRTIVALITGAARLLGRHTTRTALFVQEEAAAWTIVDHERLMLSGKV